MTANQSTPATTPVRTAGRRKADDTLSSISDYLTNKQRCVDESMTPSTVFALDIANEFEAIRCPVARRRARFTMQEIVFRAHMAQAKDEYV